MRERHPRFDRGKCKVGNGRFKVYSDYHGEWIDLGEVWKNILITHFERHLKKELERLGYYCCQIDNYVLWSGLLGLIYTTAQSSLELFVSMPEIRKNPLVQAFGEPKHILKWGQGTEPIIRIHPR